MMNKSLLGILVLLLTSCSTWQPAGTPAQRQPVSTTAPAATRARDERPTPAGLAGATPTAARSLAPALPTSVTATATRLPSSTPTAAQSAKSPVRASSQATLVVTGSSAMSYPSLDSRKYTAPVLLAPDDKTVYHVAQPVVHFAWANTPDDLMRFGQMAQCKSDGTHFRKAFESTHLVVRSLDSGQIVAEAFMDTGTDYDLNLTTLSAGRYVWSVSIGVVCESYVIGERYNLPQPMSGPPIPSTPQPITDQQNESPLHESTLERVYLGPVSPTSASRTFVWNP